MNTLHNHILGWSEERQLSEITGDGDGYVFSMAEISQYESVQIAAIDGGLGASVSMNPNIFYSTAKMLLMERNFDECAFLHWLLTGNNMYTRKVGY